MQVTDEMVEAAWEAYDNAPGYFTNSELMRAALTAALKAMWRTDLENAPNMEPVLLAIRGRKLPIVVFRFNAGASWRDLESGKEVEGNLAPTHFMPLPPPPMGK